MKKILSILLVLLIFSVNSVCAQNNLSFIYINGSNNNDKKMEDWYKSGINKLHPVLKRKFQKNSAIKKYYAPLGGFNVKDEPIIYFWGNKSKEDLDFVKARLDISRAISSYGAYFARNLIAKYLHDAIWVQKPHNMFPILDELNEVVKKEAKNESDVILYGYSAGTFVTYQYIFNKLRYINLEKLFEALNADEELLSFVKKNPRKNTCISALTYKYAGLGAISSAGHLVPNQDREQLKQNYLNLDEMTELACAPEKHFRGIVNFASPVVLFYSDFADSNYELNYYNKLMIKYILENGIYMITVNFREDPLGFPISRNTTISDIEKILGLKIENPSGVIYDNSGVWSKRFFALAHTSYWSARGTFSNAIVKSFVNGYKFQYDKKYQQKVLKRHNKKSEL